MLVLRNYHTKVGVLVNKFEGTVERFSGDGLLVVFNDPLPCPNPSIRAVQMAVEMRDVVAKLSVEWSHYGHDIGFGVGIAHGYATLGSIGYRGGSNIQLRAKWQILPPDFAIKQRMDKFWSILVCSALSRQWRM